MLHVKLAPPPGLSRGKPSMQIQATGRRSEKEGLFLCLFLTAYHSRWKSPVPWCSLKCFQIFLNCVFQNSKEEGPIRGNLPHLPSSVELFLPNRLEKFLVSPEGSCARTDVNSK